MPNVISRGRILEHFLHACFHLGLPTSSPYNSLLVSRKHIANKNDKFMNDCKLDITAVLC
jgi:hypothetical protein